MEIITSGLTRIVIVLDLVVIKIARPDDHILLKNDHGKRANLTEYSLSSQHPDKLCPVHWCEPDGSVLVMSRARPMTDEEFKQLDHGWFSEFRRGLPIEYKSSSLGYLNNKLVAIDYGG